MPESRHDYGTVNRIQAEAIGVPGQRKFCLNVANSSDAATLWLEKEQLAALGRAIETQFSRLRALRANRDLPTPDPADAYTGEPRVELRVGQLALGFDERKGLFLLLVYSVDDEDDERPSLSCEATPRQFEALAQEIARVVAAGRPICPLCGQPVDPQGHACARTNGHLKQQIPPLPSDDG